MTAPATSAELARELCRTWPDQDAAEQAVRRLRGWGWRVTLWTVAGPGPWRVIHPDTGELVGVIRVQAGQSPQRPKRPTGRT